MPASAFIICVTLAFADPPAGTGAMAPNVSTASDGAVILSWLEPTDPRATGQDRLMRLCFAEFENGAWSDARTIVETDKFFANWADLPRVVEAMDGSLLASWLQMAGEGTYAYHIMLARSKDGGATWQILGRAHDDASATEHGFVSAAIDTAKNQTNLFWLDGREMAPEAHEDAGHAGDEMELRTAIIGQAGAEPSILLDTRVCECCNTAAAITSDGPIIAYRDRSEQEIRDISFVRWTGEGWTDPAPVARDGWRINGCPVNGPAIAARGDDVVVAWFTGAEMQSRVRASFSHDGGETFEAPVEVAPDALGRVDVVHDGNGGAIVCWIGATDQDAAIFVGQVRAGGTMGEAVRVADVSSSRASGFPKIAWTAGKNLLVVWTAVGEDGRPAGVRVRTIKLWD